MIATIRTSGNLGSVCHVFLDVLASLQVSPVSKSSPCYLFKHESVRPVGGIG